MKRLKPIFCAVMAIAVLAYLLLMPPYLMEALQKDPYHEWMQPEREPYTGIITLWHIVGFKPYMGSLGNRLADLTKKLEKRHKGVFFEVSSIGIEEAEEKLARGEQADLYSFPLGWAYEEQLKLLEQDAPMLLDSLRDVGRGGGLRALPYAMSGNCVLINTALVEAAGVSLPDRITREWLQTAGERLAFSGDVITAARLNISKEILPYDAFLSGEAALAFADLRQAGELSQKTEAGKGFAFSAYPLDHFTDEVQMIGVTAFMQEEKRLYAEELIALLFEEEVQAGFAELGLFPVTELSELPKYPAEILSKCAEYYRTPAIPNTFSYHKEKGVLTLAAEQAVGGDPFSHADFSERFKSLVSMEKIK